MPVLVSRLRRLLDWRRRLEIRLRASVLFPAGEYEFRMYRTLRSRIVVQAIFAAVVGAGLYSAHDRLGAGLEQAVAFMQFHEVFRFELPDRAWFDRVARILLLILLGRYGVEFLWRSHARWFSALVYERVSRRVFILHRRPFREVVHIIPQDDILALALRRGWLDRLTGSGEAILTSSAGVYTVRSLYRASELIRDLA